LRHAGPRRPAAAWRRRQRSAALAADLPIDCSDDAKTAEPERHDS